MNARRIYCATCAYHKKKRRAKWFVNLLILLCLGVCLYITINTVEEYRRLDMPMDAGALAVLGGIWGGELLLIAARQVLGSDITHHTTQNNEEEGAQG